LKEQNKTRFNENYAKGKNNVVFKISDKLIKEHQGHKRILSPKRGYQSYLYTNESFWFEINGKAKEKSILSIEKSVSLNINTSRNEIKRKSLVITRRELSIINYKSATISNKNLIMPSSNLKRVTYSFSEDITKYKIDKKVNSFSINLKKKNKLPTKSPDRSIRSPNPITIFKNSKLGLLVESYKEQREIMKHKSTEVNSYHHHNTILPVISNKEREKLDKTNCDLINFNLITDQKTPTTKPSNKKNSITENFHFGDNDNNFRYAIKIKNIIYDNSNMNHNELNDIFKNQKKNRNLTVKKRIIGPKLINWQNGNNNIKTTIESNQFNK